MNNVTVPSHPCPSALPLQIIHQDESLVAVNKPSGLLVHRSSIDSRETLFALQLVRDQIGQHVYPVHRLDKPTSGVLLFALNSEAAAALSQQFSERKICKSYLAVVRGYTDDAGSIDHPLRRIRDARTQVGQTKDAESQPALTHYKTLARHELNVAVDRYPSSRYSLVQLTPVTGRQHQLRRHMKHIGHPIIGDAKHGKGVHNRFFKAAFNSHRLLLACTRMSVFHPVTSHAIELVAQLDEPFTHILKSMGWGEHQPHCQPPDAALE